MSKVRDIVIVSGFVIFTVFFGVKAQFAEDDRREEVALRLAELEQTDKPCPFDYELMRQAAWDAQHPCGTGVVIPAPFYALNDFPPIFPKTTSKWCLDRAAEQAARQAKMDAEEFVMPVFEMFDCAYDYDGRLQPIDKVDSPNVHNSWVLGGECEQVAHTLRDKELEGEVWNSAYALEDDPRQNGLCVSFTDDSPIEAYKCQTEMRRWLEVHCLNTTEDSDIRRCLRVQLSVPTVEGNPFMP